MKPERLEQLKADNADGGPGLSAAEIDDLIEALEECNAGLRDGAKRGPLAEVPEHVMAAYLKEWNHLGYTHKSTVLAVLNADRASEQPAGQCERCHGAGWLYPHEAGDHETQQRYRCEDCLGTGKQPAETPAPAADAGMVDVRCDKCGKAHFEGDCKLDPSYADRHVVSGQEGTHFAEAARIAKRVKDQEINNDPYRYRDLADAILLVISELQRQGGQ